LNEDLDKSDCLSIFYIGHALCTLYPGSIISLSTKVEREGCLVPGTALKEGKYVCSRLVEMNVRDAVCGEWGRKWT
jgi:hypothetical protein